MSERLLVGCGIGVTVLSVLENEIIRQSMEFSWIVNYYFYGYQLMCVITMSFLEFMDCKNQCRRIAEC